VARRLRPRLGALAIRRLGRLRRHEFIGSMINAAGAEGKGTSATFRSGAEAARLWTQSGVLAWEVAGSANVYLNPNFRIGAGGQFVHRISGSTCGAGYRRRASHAGAPWSVWGYATSYTIASATSYVAARRLQIVLDAPNSTLQCMKRRSLSPSEAFPPPF